MTDLQALVDTAEPGAEVRLPPGVWSGGLTIERNLHLIGPANGPPCVIDGEGEGSCITVEHGVDLHVERVSLVNGSSPQGGGLRCEGEVNCTLNDVVIRACAATYFGGGAVFLDRGRLRLERCVLEGNQGPQGGALLLDRFAKASIVQCLIVHNTASLGGGLCLKDAARVALHGVTLADNRADQGGSQIYMHGTLRRAPSLVIFNSIVATEDPADRGVDIAPAAGPDTVCEADCRFSILPVALRPAEAQLSDSTTRFVDPLFLDRDSYRLRPTSPAASAGNVSGLAGGLTDLSGRSIDDDSIDLGAFQR